MKKLVILLFAFLLVGCVSQAELDQAVSLLEFKDSTISSLEDQISILTESKTGLTDELETLQVSYEKAEAERLDSQSKLTKANNEVSKLTQQVNKMVCDDQITDMKYENILDASTILSAWWAHQPIVDRVQGAYRDSIWSNADTKIHGIRYISSEDNQPYVEHFLVYFDEFGWKPGVFWVSGQCWLDVP